MILWKSMNYMIDITDQIVSFAIFWPLVVRFNRLFLAIPTTSSPFIRQTLAKLQSSYSFKLFWMQPFWMGEDSRKHNGLVWL